MTGHPEKPHEFWIPACAGMTMWVLSLFLFLAAREALAAPAGAVTHLSGALSVVRADGSVKLLSQQSEVAEGDTLATAKDSFARVKFSDGGEVTLRPESQVKIQAFAFDEAKPEKDNSFFSLLKGGLRAITGQIAQRNQQKYRMQTATATIGIRGTHFGLLFCQDDCAGIPTRSGKPPENGLHLDVAQGEIVATNPAGVQFYGAGQFGFVRDIRTPPVIVPPGQGIRVTLPPAITANIGGGGTIGSKRDDIECAIE